MPGVINGNGGVAGAIAAGANAADNGVSDGSVIEVDGCAAGS